MWDKLAEGTAPDDKGRGDEDMILIGVGGNLAAPGFTSALATCQAALTHLADQNGICIETQSPWYRTRPVPASDQPWFVNCVCRIASKQPPTALLQQLHAVEAVFGRERKVRNAARTVDLDLLSYGDMVTADDAIVALPHPRLHQRLFVLKPLLDIAPDWRHPKTGEKPAAMIAEMSVGDGDVIRMI